MLSLQTLFAFENQYLLGTNIINFMVERVLINLVNTDYSNVIQAKNKGGSYYIPKHCFVSCNFDISLLSVKLKLPMVYKPIDWEITNQMDDDISLADLTRGYLSTPSGESFLVTFAKTRAEPVMYQRGKESFIKLKVCTWED